MVIQKGKHIKCRYSKNFGVSYDSAKRDLRILEEKGFLKRIHGGALPLRQIAAGRPAKMTIKDISSMRENYLEIAREAVAMIRNNDVIYIPAATVGLFMVQNLHAISFWNTLIDSSKMTVGLYPKEKIGFDSIVSICSANRLDILITDWDASEEDLKLFDEQNIKVVVVEKTE